MAYVYLIVALSWLLGLLCLAVLLAPPVLWFLHRRDANFARPVRWVARIDLAFILSWFVSFFFFNLRDVRPDGVGYDLLYIVFGLLTLIAVWKMKAGEGFRGLFRNPGTGKFPFAVYLLTAAGVAVVTVVSLVSYVIVAACIVLLFWLLFIKLDVLSMAFGGSGGGGGSVSEEAVAGIVGVRPVDQDGVEEDMPSVTAKATKKTGENFVRIALSTDGVVPIHQSEGAGKGAWVGVAIEAPEGYEQGTFQYHFGTEASAEATQSAAITEDSSIGQGKYAVFFLNASSTAPKTHITVKWEGQEAVQYVVDLSGVQTPAVKLTGVTVSTHEMPSGVSSTAEGLSFDGSTALVQNGGSGTLTHTQVASMGGGGEYTVYYTVPQAIPGGTLQFDKVARSVNGGKWNTWAMPSTTEANAGSGWWTRDGENYYFKWGAVFAEEAEGSYRLKDGGVFDYTLCFIDTDGSQDNIIATYTFQIDLSGYTITADE